MKIVSVGDIPPELIRTRDRWRYFWSKIPLIGEFYRRFIYIRRMDKWIIENNIDCIIH